MIKSMNHQTKSGDLDKRLDVFYCLNCTQTPRQNLFFFLYNVCHITAPTGYLYIQYFTRLYPKAVCESSPPNLPPDRTWTKKWASEQRYPEQRITPTPTSVVIWTSTCRKSMHMQPSIRWDTEAQQTRRPRDTSSAQGVTALVLSHS